MTADRMHSSSCHLPYNILYFSSALKTIRDYTETTNTIKKIVHQTPTHHRLAHNFTLWVLKNIYPCGFTAGRLAPPPVGGASILNDSQNAERTTKKFDKLHFFCKTNPISKRQIMVSLLFTEAYKNLHFCKFRKTNPNEPNSKPIRTQNKPNFVGKCDEFKYYCERWLQKWTSIFGQE